MPPTPMDGLRTKHQIMKALIKLACMAALLITTTVTRADWVSGHYRSNGTYVAPYYRSDYGSLGGASGYNYTSGSSSDYVYRNPYAAIPSVTVRGYYRSNGTYVAPHVRTAPNDTVTDNLSYRAYGTVRAPNYSLGR